MSVRKIINDPVYGFINIADDLVFDIIRHPYYQRLRRIHQMALAHLVYPGAVHTRLHHSLGAYHLMGNALNILKSKGVNITEEEELGAKAAILLHDIGHGPFSHALESVLVKDSHHEEISLLLMQKLNKEFHGALDKAIEIFTGRTDKHFLHQLVSSQLDVDRMDYLIRDSFFTGVSEGVIGYDRILNMLIVHKNELMVEEKGIQSIEKFLVSRRFMYWQVYLHKTVLCAEKMLVKALQRAAEIGAKAPSDVLNTFLHHKGEIQVKNQLEEFCQLDDTDITFAVKQWAHHKDKILATLCRGLLNRNLLKVRYHSTSITGKMLDEKKQLACDYLQISKEEADYLVFSGEVKSTTYNPGNEHINILFKDGTVKDISEVDHPLIHQSLLGAVKKFYICYLNMNFHPEAIH
ncbi:MAG: HD domain-containing protein [Chitinophagaceae bacterium]|nr:HD domain-containing protein [Chitinophagaceae bacterium]